MNQKSCICRNDIELSRIAKQLYILFNTEELPVCSMLKIIRCFTASVLGHENVNSLIEMPQFIEKLQENVLALIERRNNKDGN